MPFPFFRRTSLRALTLALLAGVAAWQVAGGTALAQRAAEPARRLSDGGELRGTDGGLDASQRRLEDGLDASPDGRVDAPLREPGLDLDLRDRPAAAAPDFDLFAGPDPADAPPPPPRRPRLDEAPPPTPAPGASAARARAPAAPAVRPPLLFDAIGPVRSPVLDNAAGLRRLDTALAGLRRSAPIGESDPFAPAGIRAGRFVLFPTLEQSVGVSDNLTNSADGVRGAFSQTTLAGRLVSDWSRHAAEVNASATYRRNFEGVVEEEPEILADGRLALDLAPDWQAALRGSLSFRRDDGFATGGPAIAAARRDILTYSAGAELARTLGPATGLLSFDAVREDREERRLFGADATLPGAGDDSFTTYTAGLRAGYELGARFQPFLAASVGRRVFDDDLSSVSRDSVIPALRAGVGFDAGEKWRGEAAVGYAWNVPDEDALETRGSPTLDAGLAWSPRRGTDVALRASTFFEPDSGNAGVSTLYQTTLGLRHRATARLDLDALGLYAYRDSASGFDEEIWGAEAGVTYWLNRELALVGRYRYDRFEGSASSYDANTVRVGLRLQR